MVYKSPCARVQAESVHQRRHAKPFPPQHVIKCSQYFLEYIKKRAVAGAGPAITGFLKYTQN